MRARRPALMSAPAKLSPGLISTLRVAAGAVGGIASGGGGGQRVRERLAPLRERGADDRVKAALVRQGNARPGADAQVQDRRLYLGRRAERARRDAERDAHVAIELGEDREAAVRLAARRR